MSARFCVVGLGALAAITLVTNTKWATAAVVPSIDIFMVNGFQKVKKRAAQ